MTSEYLAQIGGTPNLDIFAYLGMWFSLALGGLILGILGSISGSLGGDRRGEALVLGIISVALGLLTLYPFVGLLFGEGGVSLVSLRDLLLITIVPLSSVCAGVLALFLRYRTRPE